MDYYSFAFYSSWSIGYDWMKKLARNNFPSATVDPKVDAFLSTTELFYWSVEVFKDDSEIQNLVELPLIVRGLGIPIDAYNNHISGDRLVTYHPYGVGGVQIGTTISTSEMEPKIDPITVNRITTNTFSARYAEYAFERISSVWHYGSYYFGSNSPLGGLLDTSVWIDDIESYG